MVDPGVQASLVTTFGGGIVTAAAYWLRRKTGGSGKTLRESRARQEDQVGYIYLVRSAFIAATGKPPPPYPKSLRYLGRYEAGAPEDDGGSFDDE